MIELQIAAQALDNGGLLEGPPCPGGQQLPAGVLQWPAAPLLQLVLALPEYLPHLCRYGAGIILPPKPVSLYTSSMLLLAHVTSLHRVHNHAKAVALLFTKCLQFVTAKHRTALWHPTTADTTGEQSPRTESACPPCHPICSTPRTAQRFHADSGGRAVS